MSELTSDPNEKDLPATGEESHPGKQAVEALRQLPETERLKVIEQVGVAVVHSFSGPLPSPEAFEKYNRVLPNAGERILSMAENEQKIRSDEIKGAQANDKRKIYGSTVTTLALVSVSALSSWLGHTNAAILIGLSGVFSGLIQLGTLLFERQSDGEN